MGKTYTISQAAKWLRVSRQSIHLAIKSGRLPATLTPQVSQIYVIDEKDLRPYRRSLIRKRSRKKS